MKKLNFNVMYLIVGISGLVSVSLILSSALYASYQWILYLLR